MNKVEIINYLSIDTTSIATNVWSLFPFLFSLVCIFVCKGLLLLNIIRMSLGVQLRSHECLIRSSEKERQFKTPNSLAAAQRIEGVSRL